MSYEVPVGRVNGQPHAHWKAPRSIAVKTPAMLGGVVLGVVLLLLSALGAKDASADRQSPLVYTTKIFTSPTATPLFIIAIPESIRTSSALATSSHAFDGPNVFNDLGWISDQRQPPENQWIEWEMEPDAQLRGLRFASDCHIPACSRPYTTTLTAGGGMTQVVTWANTEKYQIQSLVTPLNGQVRLTINTVWDNSRQPVGIKELSFDAVRVDPTPSPGGGNALPIPTPPQTDPWRLVLIGVLVVLAGIFVLRGMRRQRGP